MGKVDPAYEAHAAPIGHLAKAVWNCWLPVKLLFAVVAGAKIRLANAIQPWKILYGPGAPFVCSASRLGWMVHDAVSITTDAGRSLKLDVDSPAVIARACEKAVQRWRCQEQG